MRKRIRDLPKNLRPREKIEAKGSQNLSDAELLALLLGTGRPKKNVISLSQLLLRHHPLSKLSQISLSELINIPGIGKTKATRILAALELGNRIYSPSSLNKAIIKTPQDILREVKDIADKKQEHIVALYLNARCELIQKQIVALGNLNSSLIEPKEIFSPAIVLPCASIIMAHNHPSQDPTPSREDIIFTKRVQAAGEILGIPLIDHIIICQSGFFSFKEGAKQALSSMLV